jgi:2-C-methyl-D-erythritol 4-phosphate cytidylyltransferase
MRNIAVILAGGKGNRFGGDLPKQLVQLAGKTIIEHTIEVFQNSSSIDEIAIVSNPDYISDIEHIVTTNAYFKVKNILIGGKERTYSSLAAIRAYDGENEDVNLIFHDAVRPFIDLSIIDRVVEALRKYNAVDVAIPTTDTIIEIDENNLIKSVPNRRYLRRSQTPQAFRLSTIKEAYSLAIKDPSFVATDDCGVVIKYLPDEKISIVEGSERNIKITYELDMFLAEKLIQNK